VFLLCQTVILTPRTFRLPHLTAKKELSAPKLPKTDALSCVAKRERGSALVLQPATGFCSADTRIPKKNSLKSLGSGLEASKLPRKNDSSRKDEIKAAGHSLQSPSTPSLPLLPLHNAPTAPSLSSKDASDDSRDAES
jgi:hypothetical protein